MGATTLKRTPWKKPAATPSTSKKPAAKGKKEEFIYFLTPHNSRKIVKATPAERKARHPKYMTADEIRKARDVDEQMRLQAYLEYCDEQGGDWVKIGENNQKLYRCGN